MRPARLLPLVCVGLSVSLLAATPKAPFAFPRSAPEAQGISSADILTFVEEADQKLDALHSMMIVRHGKVVAEGWWSPYAANEPHMLFSLSKSFTSTGIGLAIAEGKVSLEDPILKWLRPTASLRPS